MQQQLLWDLDVHPPGKIQILQFTPCFGVHDDTYVPRGRYILREDGFVGLSVSENTTASLLRTKPLMWLGGAIALNVDCGRVAGGRYAFSTFFPRSL